MVHNLTERQCAAFPPFPMLVIHTKTKNLSFTIKYKIRTQLNTDNSWVKSTDFNVIGDNNFKDIKSLWFDHRSLLPPNDVKITGSHSK